MPIKKNWVSWEEFQNVLQGGDWTPSPHTHVKVDITDTPWAWADVLKTGSNLTDLATRQHAGLSDAPADAHHAQTHAASHHVAGADLLAFASITGFGDYLDQAVKQASSPTFNNLTLNGGILNFPASYFLTRYSDHLRTNFSVLCRDVKNSNLYLSGGDLYNDGARILLHGSTHATQANKAFLYADAGFYICQSSYYVNSSFLVANNKVADSYKWHGCEPAGLTIGHVLKATGASAIAFQANNLGGLSDITLGTLEEGETITYDQGTAKWIDAWGVEYDNPRLVYKIYTDFFGYSTAASPPWTGAAVSGGTMAGIGGESNHPGIIKFRSGTTANSGYRFATENDAILIAGKEHAELVFQMKRTTDVRVKYGFQDSFVAGDPVDGVWLDALDGLLYGKVAGNSLISTTATYYTLSLNTWYRVKIAINADASRVDYYLYSAAGQQLWTDYVNTNIPTGAGRTTGHMLMATHSGTAAYDLIYADMMMASRAGTLIR